MPILLRTKGRSMCLCALFSVLVFLAAPSGRAQETQPKINPVPPKPTSAASGEQMFNAYCAACHGKGAKGDGPAAPALKVPVANLTTLAQRNGGKYPEAHVSAVIRFGAEAHGAHGSQDMPVWGPIFSSMDAGAGSPGMVNQRISNLTRYIGTLQVK